MALLLFEESINLQALPHYRLFTYEVKLIQHIDQVDLIALLELPLDNLAKFFIELFDQDIVTLRVDLHGRHIGLILGHDVLFVNSYLLLPLLIDCCLMEHVECGFAISGTHQLGPVVDLGLEENLATSISHLAIGLARGGIEEADLTPTNVSRYVGA